MMGLTASSIFEFLNKNSVIHLDRYEVFDRKFSLLRKSVRQIIGNFRETDDNDGHEAANQLQSMLSEWLTLPLPFDTSVIERLSCLGSTSYFRQRWGHQMGTFYEAAQQAAHDLVGEENPVECIVREHLLRMQNEQTNFRIFCQRPAVPIFNQVVTAGGGNALRMDSFIHSPSGYRDSPPFDELLKVGPLRSRGWGAIPDAILTAPRFRKLIQVVWSGCKDEPDFGYDPVTRSAATDDSQHNQNSQSSIACHLKTKWMPTSIRKGDDPDYIPDEDEFQLFKTWNQERIHNERRAVLVQIDEGQGILYPPLSKLLCFDPMEPDSSCITYHIPGETHVEDTFIIRPVLDDPRSTGARARHGRLSRAWKEQLRKKYRANPRGLIRELDKQGLRLLRLDVALIHWMKPPTTVIHAPQQKRHFEILLRVLAPDFTELNSRGYSTEAVYEHAWREICHSRGEAIHAGFMNNVQTEEQFCSILTAMIPQIRATANAQDGFSLALPDGHPLEGLALFNRVRAVEEGFRVPSSELHLAHELSKAEQWRA
ncbi:hypothetical protein [Noviherbaspirillum galbum]|uniref:Uncharacterized protein n=1 Tax=Noviherbaspirillum galbum TaxID=2709383 RepID=A0A6B3ST05_9BURK|nr:hypothetical protein [Noviherbaspirillum galbum]NEX62475.1 hypothetical protein [Noviherbaspirillum galbum]